MWTSVIVIISIVAAFLLGFRFILRFFGMVSIPEDRIGLVTKKFGGARLDGDRIIAINAEAGFQAYTLGPGLDLLPKNTTNRNDSLVVERSSVWDGNITRKSRSSACCEQPRLLYPKVVP